MKKLLLALLLITVFTSASLAQRPALWGMTFQGGRYNQGTIFYMDSTGKVTDMHDFDSTNNHDAARAIGGFIKASDGLLYGMTSWGGAYNWGAIISYDISTGKETVLHSFGAGNDGRQPIGNLLQASDGQLYGLTVIGGSGTGSFGSGALICYNISTGVETVLHNFGNGTDGNATGGSLIQASNGLLYGMAAQGGPNQLGTIFTYNISTNTYNDFYDFGTSSRYDGTTPIGSLMEDNGYLYGTTSQGGINDTVYGGDGTIFSIIENNSYQETDLHDFDASNYTGGYEPYCTLFKATNGVIYGSAYHSNNYNGEGPGLFFSLSYGNYTDIFSFGGHLGANPGGTMLQGRDSLLYGTTPYGNSISGWGAIFSYNPKNGDTAAVHNFLGSEGESPCETLLEVDDNLPPQHVVWPGDANDDLLVDNNDLLSIGLYYGTYGIARDTVTNTWAPHPGFYWGALQSNGYDIKYADCNGDGIIDANDTLAIKLNYSDTHLFHKPRTTNRSAGTELYFIADSNSYHAGSAVTVAVEIGHPGDDVVNLYGLAYDIGMDTSLIEQGSLALSYVNSFLGTQNTDALALSHTGSDAETAAVRTDHHNRTGHGQIGVLRFTLKPSAPAGYMVFAVTEALGVDSSANNVPLQLSNDSIYIINTTTGINQLSINTNQFSIYPNPTSNQLTVSSNQLPINQITITNVLGEIMYKTASKNLGLNTTINVSNYAEGMYFVTVTLGSETATQKLIVIK